ncbi:MAG: hypothetical protein K5770_09865 [Lachnospiraceae bacterium]|nr:hypothetical protein [Lachnospiraceae bacterium]
MAVGKGSMERAAKAAEKKTGTKTAPAKGASKAVVGENVIAAPDKEVVEKVVYQKSSGMLERAAEPNERFSVGDPMPVYYF